MDQVIFGGLLSEPPQVTDSFTGVIYIFDESRELDSQRGPPDKNALKFLPKIETENIKEEQSLSVLLFCFLFMLLTVIFNLYLVICLLVDIN